MPTKTKNRATTNTLAVRAAQLLEIARQEFGRATDWTQFSNAIYGVGGPFARLFPTQGEREAFERTDEQRQIQDMLEKLQGGSDDAALGPTPSEGQARFVLRLPRSMFEALKAEASAEGVSINTLCVAKLGTKLRGSLSVKC